MADIDISHYSTGTATVSTNGTAVTGQGTAWVGAVRPGDLFGTHVGLPIRIASVESNTALTLAHPWPGDAQTAAAYEIQRSPYELGYQKAVEELIAGISEGNLPLLSALTAAANKLPYFDSSNSMVLADLSPFARTLLDDANAGAARDTLALPAWLATFGIGQTGSPTSITNFNSATAEAAGLYAFASGASNGPPDSFTGVLLVANYSATARTQLAMSATGPGVMWTRQFSGGSWSGWKPVTPQMISNPNGVAWRFASGLQICAQFTALQADANTSSGGSFNGTVAWNFPAPFAAGSQVNAFSISGSTIRWGGNATGISASGCTLRHFSMSQSVTTSNLFGIAIGQYE